MLVLSWRVSFSEAVQKVDAQDFTFAGSPDSAQAAVYLLEEGVYRVVLSGAGAGRTDGSVTLAFASDQDIENLSGAPLASVIPTAVNDPVHVLGASPLALSGARSGPSFEQEAYAFSLPENRSGPFVLGQVTARDPSGELPTYLLEGAGEAPFALDAASGEVRYTGAGEDYEAGLGAYAFTAEAARAEGAREGVGGRYGGGRKRGAASAWSACGAFSGGGRRVGARGYIGVLPRSGRRRSVVRFGFVGGAGGGRPVWRVARLR